jgi:hypothetical protein
MKTDRDLSQYIARHENPLGGHNIDGCDPKWNSFDEVDDEH